jgi:hypothetical protein
MTLAPAKSLKGRTMVLDERYDVTMASHCQYMMAPPRRKLEKEMRLHHSQDASPFPGFKQTCFVYILCFSERIINSTGLTGIRADIYHCVYI